MAGYTMTSAAKSARARKGSLAGMSTLFKVSGEVVTPKDIAAKYSIDEDLAKRGLIKLRSMMKNNKPQTYENLLICIDKLRER